MLRKLAISVIASTLLFGSAAPSFAADVIFVVFALHRTAQEGDRDLCIDHDASGKVVVHDGYIDEFDCEAAGHVWSDEARRGRLGFGDIVPVSKPARMFAMLQAIFGQLYVAIVVARLVGLHISQNR